MPAESLDAELLKDLRCTLEVLHADVLCIGLDNERQCTNPDQIRRGNQRS